MTTENELIVPVSVESAARQLEAIWAEGRATVVADAAGADLTSSNAVVVSVRGLDQLVDLDVDNSVLVCEAGMAVGDCRVAADGVGLWCPALRWLPANAAIGAAVAAGHGRRSRRYGTAADYVLGLRFASPAVGLARHGGKAIKNATGYNLSGMVAGSRGEFGVILEVTLRLLPRPRRRLARLYAVGDPSVLWDVGRRLAGAVAGTGGRAPATSEQTLAAIEAWSPFQSTDARLLVETEGEMLPTTSMSPGDANGATLRLVETLADGAPWPDAPVGLAQRHARIAYNPSLVATELKRIASMARGHRLGGYLLAELTGGGVEVAYAADQGLTSPDVSVILGLPEPSTSGRAFRAALKTAFDPRGLLSTTTP